MKNRILISKIIAILLSIINFTTIYATSTESIVKYNATTWPYFDEEISSKAAFIMDADSSKVLFSYNPDTKLYPASLTKVMTAIIVLERTNGDYNDLVTFSYNAVTRDIDKNSATIGASAGDQLTVKDCLYSLLLPSANDAANALAEYIAGSIDDFALLMNEKAQNLGLKNTHFVNPSGLHDDNQYTTVSDMATIFKCAMQYPIFMQISSSVSYKHAPIRRYKNPDNSNNQVLNTNSIMVPGSGYYYSGITAGKTGHTKLAGHNLVCSAKKNGMNLISVVMGSSSEKIRFNETKKLLNFYFDNYKSLSIKNWDPRFSKKINTISINDVDIVKSLDITCTDESHITIPKNADMNKIESKLTYQVNDIYNKYAIGSVTYYYDNQEIGTCSIEGRDISKIDTIFTSHLDLSKPLSNDGTDIENSDKQLNNSSHFLLVTDANGNKRPSKTLITLIIVIFTFIVLIFIAWFLYFKIFTNLNFPLNKLIFRTKRFFK